MHRGELNPISAIDLFERPNEPLHLPVACGARW